MIIEEIIAYNMVEVVLWGMKGFPDVSIFAVEPPHNKGLISSVAAQLLPTGIMMEPEQLRLLLLFSIVVVVLPRFLRNDRSLIWSPKNRRLLPPLN